MAKMYIDDKLVSVAPLRECLAMIHNMCAEKGCTLQRYARKVGRKKHLNENVINRSLKGLNIAYYEYKEKAHLMKVVCCDGGYNVFFIAKIKV